MHGYQLIQEIVERSGDTWKPSPGAIYPALNLLEDEGLIVMVSESGRKLASLTEEGKAYIADHQDQLNTVWDDAAGRGAHPARELRKGLEGIAVAARQVAVAGTEQQIKDAKTIIEQSQRDLYLILARQPESEGETTGDQPTSN